MTTTKPQPKPFDLHQEAAERGVRLMSGSDLVALLDKICEDMTQSEREALADELDPKWRDNGRTG